MNLFMRFPVLKKICTLLCVMPIALQISCNKDSDILADYVVQDVPNFGQYVVDDTFVLNGSEAVLLDVLANDTFQAGQEVVIVEVSDPKHGTVEVNDNSEIVYTPSGNQDNTNQANEEDTSTTGNDGDSSSDTETSTGDTTAAADTSAESETETDTFEYTVEVEEEDGTTTSEKGTVTVESSGDEVPEETEEQNSYNNVIPADFDWSNIPDSMGNSVWEIVESFNLEGQTVVLPDNVTLMFKGGSLTNGTLTLSNTIIESEGNDHILNAIDLAGTLSSEYIKPQWFGAAMDGNKDDRAYFVETVAQSKAINAKVLIDGKIFLDVAETGTKSIFLDDNQWIEGTPDSELIINNLRSPAFIIALADNVTFKNLNILWKQTYSTLPIDSQTNGANQAQVEEWLTANRGMTFRGADPSWSGAISFWAVFNIRGSSNILLEDVSLRVPEGANAQQFCPYFMKLTTEYNEGSTVTNEGSDPRTQTTNVTLRRLTLDGTIMGVQGNVSNFNVETLRSYRYSDIQSAAGGDIGGNGGTWSPPPHLFYINRDGQPNDSRDITMTDVIDYGEYVGSVNVRSGGGYCNSLKLTDDITNVLVDGYKSYRRDGLADMQNITNGTFKNIYAESETSIFQDRYKFNTLRFLGNFDNVTFENMTLKDNSLTSTVYPLDSADGVNVSLKGVEVITTSPGCFRLRGSNNSIEDSSLNMCN